jgi:hypothetical protein
MGKITLKVFAAFITFMVGVTTAMLWHTYHRTPPRLSSCLSANSSPSEESGETEGYAVYSALIKDEFVKEDVKLLVISERTQFYDPDYLQSTTSEQRIQDLKKEYASVAEDTLRDYEAKHIQPSTLEAKFDLPVKYILVDEAKLGQAEEGARILAFQEQYKDAGGIISLSKVGFNKDRNEALVRVAYLLCPLCRHSGKVLLRKVGGVWKVA